MRRHLQELGVVNNFREHKEVSELFVVDWDATPNNASRPKGVGGCITDTKKPTVDSLLVKTAERMDIISFGFQNGAWKKQGVGQCDAVLFPATDSAGDAVLFVELKYSIRESSWQNYREKALKQIVDTLRELLKSCPLLQRKLYGVISFPHLCCATFGSTMYSPAKLREIFQEYNLELQVSNSVIFRNPRTISVL